MREAKGPCGFGPGPVERFLRRDVQGLHQTTVGGRGRFSFQTGLVGFSWSVRFWGTLSGVSSGIGGELGLLT